jgi:hypothetical protein
MSWFIHLTTEVYGGSGNRRKKRIQMLLEKYKQQGYQIYIQGDADGKNTNIFKNLIETGLISNENAFVFTHDFESSIPLEILYYTLIEMNFIEGISMERFCETIRAKDLSVVTQLKDYLGIDISLNKIEFATTVAGILNHPDFIWWRDDTFLGSELGQFLQFIQKII